jgi:ubiquinone/menaquinone biosynthesis C-methylase UbiE
VGIVGFVVGQLGRPSRITGNLLNLANAKANRRALEHLNVSADESVLEVGFGGGAALRKLASRAAFVAGVDRSPASVRAARDRLSDPIAQGRVRVEQADVEALPFDDHQFDAALGVHTIYFWSVPEAGLREVLRVLRPGGRLLLVTDTRSHPDTVTRGGLRSYDRADLTGLLQRAGFGAVHAEEEGSFLYTLARRTQ